MTFQKVLCPSCNKVKSLYFSENSRLSDKKCYECRKKDEVKELSKNVKEAGKSICEDYIICPYCGYDFGTDDMHYSTDVQCYECNNKFHVEVEYSVSYSTSKIKLTEEEKE